MEFWVYECARIYQRSLGGDIYAVDISRSVDSATDTVTTHLASSSALLATQLAYQ